MLDFLKTIAGIIMGVVAAIFGAHQVATILPPVAPPHIPTASALPTETSSTATQQFQDLSSQQHQTNTPSAQSAQHSTASSGTPTAARAISTAPFGQLGNPLLDYATKADLASSTAALNAAFQSQLAALSTVSPSALAALQNEISQTNRISQLPTNIVVSGVTGLTSGDIPDLSGKYLSLGGGTLSGAFTDTSTASATFAGALGIGTTNPGSKLEVQGLTSAQYFNATSTTNFSTFAGGFVSQASSTVVGNFTDTGLSTLGTLSLTSGTTTNFFATTASSTNLFAQSATLGALTVNGATTNSGLATFLNGFLSLASSTITSGLFSMNGGASTTNLTASGTAWIGNGAFTSTTGTTTVAAGQGFTVGGSQFVVQQGSGNVGIGTTSPSQALSVQGNGYITGSLQIGTRGTLLKTDANGQVAAAISGTDYQAPITASYPIQFSSNNLSLAFGTTTTNTWSAQQNFGATIVSPDILANAPWYFGAVGHTANFIDTSGTGATAEFSHTADNNTAGQPYPVDITSACGITHDNTSILRSTWCQYWQGTITAAAVRGTGTATANNPPNADHMLLEGSFQNLGVAATPGAVNPYATGSNAALNAIELIRLDNGIGSGPTPNSIDAVLHILNNGGVFEEGIVFDSNSLDTTSGRIAPALSLAQSQGVDWYATNGPPAWSIYSSATGGTNSLILSNTAASFSSSVAIGTANPYSSLTIDGAASAASGTHNSQALFDLRNLNTGSNLVFGADPNSPYDFWIQNRNSAVDNNYSPISLNPLGGNVGIGTTSPTTALQVNGAITPNADNTSSLGNATYRWSSVFAANGTIQTSDARLKSNVNDLSYGLLDLLKLRPVSFTWTAQPQQGTQLGFIAQEVQPILPETVNVGDDANHTLGLTYTEFIPIIVKSIQQIASISGAFQTNLIAWLGNASNGINDLFAKNLYASHQLCVDKSDGTAVCITGDQLAAILAATGQTPSSSGQGSGSSGASATSTPDTPPVIQISGNNPATITVGSTYSDLGATITGPQQDLNLGIHVSVDGGATTTPDQISIDTSTTSTHTITYFATGQNGLTSSATRTVIVQAATSTP